MGFGLFGFFLGGIIEVSLVLKGMRSEGGGTLYLLFIVEVLILLFSPHGEEAFCEVPREMVIFLFELSDGIVGVT